MREILFRGKTDKGEWKYGMPCATEQSGIYAVQTLQGGIFDIIPETIGQYTGLTDKNGTKIFEGDIIKFGISQRLMYVHWNEETLTWELTDVGVPTCEVNHLSNTFDLGEIQVESAYGKMFSEVIGNIHDNPELINN